MFHNIKKLSAIVSLSDSGAYVPLERIHCDLWAQSPIMGIQGFNIMRFLWITTRATLVSFL